MGDDLTCGLSDASPMRGQTVATRRFWWDRTTATDVEVSPLRAVIFDFDDAVADVGADGDLTPRAGLIDLVMNLFVAGVWVGVVSRNRRAEVEPLVRELIGDGFVETIVTSDDTESTDGADLYELALWEFGIEPESALGVVGSSASRCDAIAAGLATTVISTDYEDLDTAADCEREHRRCWAAQKRAA
jgi:beta-phosphoglucomutase-like phosphatase (HAD superfamily)